MKLYGTTTSPFVRRVRVVASECGEPIEIVNTAADDGQAQLREVSPIRKVPVAVVDGGRVIYDSRAIIDWITTARGWGTIAPPRDKWHELNLLNAIDAALESVISLFYLRRDGLSIDGTPFATRQLDRADAIFTWVAPQLRIDTFGLPELSACAALDWMEFRQVYDVKRATSVATLLPRVRATWAERPSMVATRPHA